MFKKDLRLYIVLLYMVMKFKAFITNEIPKFFNNFAANHEDWSCFK